MCTFSFHRTTTCSVNFFISSTFYHIFFLYSFFFRAKSIQMEVLTILLLSLIFCLSSVCKSLKKFTLNTTWNYFTVYEYNPPLLPSFQFSFEHSAKHVAEKDFQCQKLPMEKAKNRSTYESRAEIVPINFKRTVGRETLVLNKVGIYVYRVYYIQCIFTLMCCYLLCVWIHQLVCPWKKKHRHQ